ncbi:MAG: phosphoribosyltransferase [Bacteroidetes bacterium]|jgi:pyrimidine operon attenuation protein/uracil phosphoribosyltransferase|nr:phosphoribosyltransferase [Bacteroidota bacterium]
MNKTLILNSNQIGQKINRIAYEIYENNYDEKEIVIAGIAKNGFLLAAKIAEVLQNISKIKVQLIEITLDKENPFSSDLKLKLTDKELKNKVIILVDDVLNSGKTLIFGAKLFLNSPVKRLTTAVLVDRGHNRYPIKADVVGLSLSTTLQEHITCELNKKGKETVYLS